MANSTNLPAQNLEPEKVENTKTGSSETSSTTTTEDKNSILSPTQEKALETIGVDPSEIPSSFTPEQLTCFEEILGKTRIEEIKTGDTPTATEFFKAKSCI